MGVGVNRLFLHRLRLWWWRASWVLPVAAVLAALLFQMTTDSVDEWLYAEGTQPFVSGVAATALLAAVGGGMVTFTGLVFSFVVLVLQFGSSQYSPRTVAFLVRNRLTQWVLALFIFTITFCFIGLIEVGSEGRDDFEPQTTVLIAVILLLASLIGFVAMLHTVGGRIRVDRVLSDIGRLARSQLRIAFLIQNRSSTRLSPVPEPPDDLAEINFFGSPGQLVAVDTAGLLRLAERHRAHIQLDVIVGDSVAFGAVVGSVAGTSPVSARGLSSCLIIDIERSLRYDPVYALRLLVDIAIRALSPAVNDPTTAVRSIDEIEGVLRIAAHQTLGPVALRRGPGTLVVPAPTWDDFCALALAEIIGFGAQQPQISRRLTALLADLEHDLPAERRPALQHYRAVLLDHVSRFAAGEERQSALTADRQGLGGSR